MNTASHLSLDVRKVLSAQDPHGKLEGYFVALMRENEKVNLVSRETGRTEFDRMVAESLLPFEKIGSSFQNYLDVGSGGGIPAIPILLTQQISGKVTLVERTNKKALALRHILDSLACTVEIRSQTFEELRLADLYDLITLRFVKLTPALLRLILSRLSPTGSFLYYSQPEFSAKESTRTVFTFAEPESSVTKSFTVFRTS